MALLAGAASAQTAYSTHSPVTNTTRTRFSDGTTATTTCSPVTNTTRTRYSDGRTATTTYSPVTRTARTRYSDGATAVTTYSPMTHTARTRYNHGPAVTSQYSPGSRGLSGSQLNVLSFTTFSSDLILCPLSALISSILKSFTYFSLSPDFISTLILSCPDISPINS